MNVQQTHTHTPSNIVIGFGAESNVLGRSVDQGHAIRDQFAAAAKSSRFDELIERIPELLHGAIGWTDPEVHCQLRKRHGIEASFVEVPWAGLALNLAPA